MFRTYEEIYDALPPVLRTKDVASALGVSEGYPRLLFRVDWGLKTITNTAFKLVSRESFLARLDSLEGAYHDA